MNLHEYQAKQLFKEYGLPVSDGYTTSSVNETVDAAKKIGGSRWVVKTQVHAGGRGKAGGVELVDSSEGLSKFAEKWLGNRLVTYQTDENGQPVHHLLVESCTDIAQELYLGAVIDRATRRVTFMASTEGGVEIEKVAEETPEKIIRMSIDPLVGAQAYQGRLIGFKLGLNPEQVKQFTKIFLGLAKMFMDHDFALLEINPLVITTDGNLLCLDGKVNIDGNALFRQPKIREMHDPTQDDPREARAAEWDLSYIALDGNIGCMVNGAGLAMATMDTIQLYGGRPANFLDVGGGATKERVTEAFKIILSDESVKGILINIFGGIVRCDMIAEGIIAAIEEARVEVPVVVRLEGNHAKEGAEALNNSGMDLTSAIDLDDAAQKIVQAVN